MRRLAFLILLAACASPPAQDPWGLDPARARTTRGQGFIVHEDSLEPAEQTELFRELVASRAAIQRIVGPHLAPGDFRTWEERRASACAPGGAGGTESPQAAAPAGDVRVVVYGSGSRCHADAGGVSVVRDHLARRDATHELVHYLAGGSWRPIDEGLATYLTERICGAAWGVPVHVRARAYLDVHLDADLDRDRMKNGMSRRDYDMAASFVKWLVETHGMDKFMELYRAAPGDFMLVYGEGEHDLEAKWLAAVRAIEIRQDGDYYRFREHLTTRGR